MTSSKPKFDNARNLFEGTLAELTKLAIRAVNDVGYKLSNANGDQGIVSFEIGMTWGSWSGVSGTITLEEAGESAYRIRASGKQNVKGKAVGCVRPV